MITIAQFPMKRSGLSFRYVQIHLDRIGPIESTIRCRPDTNWDDVARAYTCSDAFILGPSNFGSEVHLECDRIRSWSRCLSRSPSRIPTI